MGAKYTDAQKRATEKHLAEKTDSIQIRVKKGKKDIYKEHAQSKGTSLNALIVKLIEDDIAAK